MKFLLITMLCGVAFAQLPSAPERQVMPNERPTTRSFRVVEGAAHPQQTRIRTFAMLPNRTNKQTLASPWFIVPHALAFAAGIFEEKRCEHVVIPGRPTVGGWGDALVPGLVATPMDYVIDRFIQRGISLGDAGYIIGRETYGGISKRYQ